MTKNFEIISEEIRKFVDCRLCLLTNDNFFHSDPGILFGHDGSFIGLNLHDVGLSDRHLNLLITRNSDLFRSLKYLDLSNNTLEFVSILTHLKNLVKLDLASNRILDIDFILDFVKLESANLRCNCLSRIPKNIFGTKLDIKIYDDWNGGLILEGNPIQDPPLEELEALINKQRAERFERLLTNGYYSRNECRVQLIGSGGAGKTTLAKSLAGREHLPNEPATRGMAIWETPLDDIRVKIWDFGGQEAMFSVHRLFIAGGEIFILVLDSRHNESADGWLEFVLSSSPDAKFIIVMNKIDENKTFDLDQGFLRRNYPDRILGFFRLSANRKTEKAFVEFKGCLKEILSDSAKSNLPVKFKALIKKFEEDDVPFVREAEFRKNFNEIEVSDAHLGLVLEQLVRMGIVIQTQLSGMGRVLIRSNWLVKNMYPLLEPDLSARDEVKDGLISENDLFYIWEDSRGKKELNESGIEDERELFSILTEIMEQNNLCYKTSDGMYFIPNFLNANSHNMPNYDGLETAHIHFIFKCTFLPKLMFQRLHVEITCRYIVIARWRSGFIVRGSENDIEGDFECYVVGDFYNREISVIASGEHRSAGFRDMYKLIKDNLVGVRKVIHQEIIVYTEQDPQGQGPKSYNLRFQDIIFHRTNKRDDYLCGDYKKIFSVDAVLKGLPKEVFHIGNNTEEKWWNDFLNISKKLYPKGIGERNIWSRSSGDLSFVNMNESGQTQWTSALHSLKMGGGGHQMTLEKLLSNMTQDFQQNMELKALEHRR
ncbi:MAG: COR domain-containing protein [Pseudomonadota bacterium]